MKKLLTAALCAAMLVGIVPASVADSEYPELTLDSASPIVIAEDGYVDCTTDGMTAAELLANFRDRSNVTLTAKDGTVLPPMDTDRGIEVIKVFRHLSMMESNSQEPALLISRMLFRKAITVQDYTPEEYRAEMEPYNRGKWMQAILQDQWKKSRVRCPNGTKVLPPMNWRRMRDFPKNFETKEPVKEAKDEK